jgi:pimeloyl-ACP methyl ester carboxylesterase
MSPRLVAAVGLAAALVVAGCSSDDDRTVTVASTSPETTEPDPTETTAGEESTTTTAETGGGLPADTLDWQECDERSLGGELVTCAPLEVPLDYDDPSAGTIELSLVRLATANDEERIGSLLVNPGGPGGSGVDFAVLGPFSSDILDRFDIIGFDPRGVARSTPLDCISDDDLEALFQLPLIPTAAASQEEQIAFNAEVTARCVEQPLALEVGTNNVARDMDEIRKALGEEQINFYGASYGGRVGWTYASLFPENFRAIVLDSPESPTATYEEDTITQIESFDGLLDSFIEWCGDNPGARCPSDVRAAIRTIIDTANAEPIPVDGTLAPLSSGLALFGIITPFYADQLWPQLADGLTDALNGDGSLLSSIASFQTDRSDDGTYSNLRDVFGFVTCADSPDRPTVQEWNAFAARIDAQFPLWAGSNGAIPSCDGIPASDDTTPVPDDPAIPPVLVVGATQDPATPYQGAVDLADALVNGALLTRDGTGHTSYGGGNDCIDDAVDTYLLTLELPPDDTVC